MKSAREQELERELRRERRIKRSMAAAIDELQGVVKLLSHETPLPPEIQALTQKLRGTASTERVH